jgi:hypothetical protein
MHKFEKRKPHLTEACPKKICDPSTNSEYFEISTEVRNKIPPRQLCNLHELIFRLHSRRTRELDQTGTVSHRAANGCLLNVMLPLNFKTNI